jgi:hypothetical protein
MNETGMTGVILVQLGGRTLSTTELRRLVERCRVRDWHYVEAGPVGPGHIEELAGCVHDMVSEVAVEIEREEVEDGD